MPDIFEIVDAGFEHAERAREVAVIWRHPTPDGGEATVTQSRLCIAPRGQPPDRDGYWYATPMGAVLSAARWIDGECRHEPDGWTRHPRTGRSRADGAARPDERAWVCRRHPDVLPSFQSGRLYCTTCRRPVVDAIHVAWPPRTSAVR